MWGVEPVEVMTGSIAEGWGSQAAPCDSWNSVREGATWSSVPGYQEAQWVELWALHIADLGSDSCSASLPAT